jgi:hypothetical protein
MVSSESESRVVMGMVSQGKLNCPFLEMESQYGCADSQILFNFPRAVSTCIRGCEIGVFD